MMTPLLRKVIQTHKPECIIIINDINQTTIKEALETILAKEFTIKSRYTDWNRTELENIFLGVKHVSIFTKYLRAKQLVKNHRYPNLFIFEAVHMNRSALEYLKQLGIRIACVIVDDIQDQKNVNHLLSMLPTDAHVLLNADKKTLSLKKKTKAKVITYGLSEKSDLQAQEVNMHQSIKDEVVHIQGMRFKLRFQGHSVPVTVAGLLGIEAVYTALASLSCAVAYQMNPIDVSQKLLAFTPLGGRLRVLEGIKQTTIIDDTHDCDTDTLKEGIDILRDIDLPSGKKKIYCLSPMKCVAQDIPLIAKQLIDAGIHVFVGAGKELKPFVSALKEHGMSEKQVLMYPSHEEAGKAIQAILKKGDLVFIDGNAQGKSEFIVKEIMAKPLQANAYLARTNEDWNM